MLEFVTDKSDGKLRIKPADLTADSKMIDPLEVEREALREVAFIFNVYTAVYEFANGQAYIC